MTEGTSLTAEDRFMIMDLYARYAWSMDSGDLDAFVDCFAPDAELNWGGPPARGREAIRRTEESFLEDSGFPGAQHFALQFRFIDGDTSGARVRAYVARLHRIPGTTNSQIIWQGFYTDTVVKLDGRWYYKIKKAHTAEELRQHHYGMEPRWQPPQFYDLGSPRGR